MVKVFVAKSYDQKIRKVLNLVETMKMWRKLSWKEKPLTSPKQKTRTRVKRSWNR